MDANKQRLVGQPPADGALARARRPARTSPSGPPAALPALRPVKPGQPTADLIRRAFKTAVARIRAADPEARRGEVEGVHRLRTATRRLRSELRTVRPLVEPDWREDLEAELKWLAGVLGDVRDLDILTKRLREAGNGEAAPDSALDPLLEVLRCRHRARSQELREALQSQRYRDLIARLTASMEHPELKDRAAKPCRKVLPSLATKAWKKLRKQARKLHPEDPDDAFHEVRKLAKQARYTAELIAPALGPETHEQAERFITLTTRVQDVLGEHQDATVALDELDRFLDEHSGDREQHHAIRALRRDQKAASERARDAFFKTWPRLDRKKSLRWM